MSSSLGSLLNQAHARSSELEHTATRLEGSLREARRKLSEQVRVNDSLRRGLGKKSDELMVTRAALKAIQADLEGGIQNEGSFMASAAERAAICSRLLSCLSLRFSASLSSEVSTLFTQLLQAVNKMVPPELTTIVHQSGSPPTPLPPPPQPGLGRGRSAPVVAASSGHKPPQAAAAAVGGGTRGGATAGERGLSVGPGLRKAGGGGGKTAAAVAPPPGEPVTAHGGRGGYGGRGGLYVEVPEEPLLDLETALGRRAPARQASALAARSRFGEVPVPKVDAGTSLESVRMPPLGVSSFWKLSDRQGTSTIRPLLAAGATGPAERAAETFDAQPAETEVPDDVGEAGQMTEQAVGALRRADVPTAQGGSGPVPLQMSWEPEQALPEPAVFRGPRRGDPPGAQARREKAASGRTPKPDDGWPSSFPPLKTCRTVDSETTQSAKGTQTVGDDLPVSGSGVNVLPWDAGHGGLSSAACPALTAHSSWSKKYGGWRVQWLVPGGKYSERHFPIQRYRRPGRSEEEARRAAFADAVEFRSHLITSCNKLS